MIYWTTYNFTGYLLYKLNYIPLNPILKTSFICTSLIGGYMVYIYPRKIVMRINNIKYNIPYPIMIIGDFITHQYPLIDTIYKQNTYNICGGYLLPIMLSWYLSNKIRIKDTKKIYGISLEKLLLSTFGFFIVIGSYTHLPKLLKY